MKNLLTTLSIELQTKLKDFNVSDVFIEMNEVNVRSEYDLDLSFIEAIERELETLNAIKSQYVIEVQTRFAECNVEVIFGDELYSFIHEDGHTLECNFENGIIFLDGEQYNGKGISKMFTIGFKTPKGYISSKKIPVSIVNKMDLTISEVKDLLVYDTDAVKNTFDPFFLENQAKRKNNIGCNYVASNYLQDDCR